ncbi:VOC family protein [Burkholderia sp. Ac-20379]|uniref:VOC family protein n=1 Tax=Burkholderia sp. Ac-20379 TaxID=2703900 RepID=UPI00197E1AC7|nr:VOC family protein [Burkholderia sp. Ac-20379]MBN3726230.1 glyoxalase/bleomycin resistance/extradiol dioxygenase family protein [Burkholderia sp. Ac-20379]
MHRQIYVNLPVREVARARGFYTALGFTPVPEFSNADAACMRIGSAIFAMLLSHPFFASFTDKPICDPAERLQTLLCLSCDDRDEVDRLVAAVQDAGGVVVRAPGQQGPMYGAAFADPDGHVWELVYLPAAGADAGAAAA